MRHVTSVLIALFASISAFSQNPADTLGNIYDDLAARKNVGTITLRNGRQYSGFIEYSTFTNVLRVDPDKGVPKPLHPRNVARFEYFDEHHSRTRTFVSREFELPEYGLPLTYEFFEIIKECNEFTLTSRSYPVDVKQKLGSPIDPWKTGVNQAAMARQYTQKALTITNQIEIICFFAGDEILPYIAYKTKEIDNLSGKGLRNNRTKKNTDILDKSLPERLMGEKFTLIKEFADANNLNWIDKDELALIVAHYDSIK